MSALREVPQDWKSQRITHQGERLRSGICTSFQGRRKGDHAGQILPQELASPRATRQSKSCTLRCEGRGHVTLTGDGEPDHQDTFPDSEEKWTAALGLKGTCERPLNVTFEKWQPHRGREQVPGTCQVTPNTSSSRDSFKGLRRKQDSSLLKGMCQFLSKYN